jgi:hypothetical protein
MPMKETAAPRQHAYTGPALHLAELFEALDLKNAIMVGYTTGGGEVVRYLARHSSSRVAKSRADQRCTTRDGEVREKSRWPAN